MNVGYKTTKDILYLEIKERIINGVLEPNTPILEDRFAKEFEVSRTPLRECIQRLEFEGLVVRQLNGRLKVASISIKEVKEVFSVRSRLEELVSNEATKNATKEDILALENIINLMVMSSKDDRREDVIRFGIEFHDYLYKLSDHHTAVKLLEQLNDHINRYRRIGPIKSRERSVIACQEHHKIFELLAAGNAEKCGEAMKNHINNSLESAINSIEKYI